MAYIFNASLENDIPELNIDDTIKFKPSVNKGNAYDESSGTFTCQQHGWYSFSFTVATGDLTTPTAAALSINGKQIAKAVTGLPSKTAPLKLSQAGNSVIVKMDPSNTAKVVGLNHKALNVVGGGYSTFTGCMVGQ